jgi:3D (Asp-Asp-Asp) domain-containing protein
MSQLKSGIIARSFRLGLHSRTIGLSGWPARTVATGRSTAVRGVRPVAAGFVALCGLALAALIGTPRLEAKIAPAPAATIEADTSSSPEPLPPTSMRVALDVAPTAGIVVESIEPVSPAAAASALRMFNGRPIRPASTVSMLVTAYSPDERSCGDSADGITASGYSVWTNGMKMVAADSRFLPLGSLVSVPGYDDGQVVPVLDRGGAIKGQRLDVLFPTHEIARQWGVQTLSVIVWEYADGKPNGFKTNHRRQP